MSVRGGRFLGRLASLAIVIVLVASGLAALVLVSTDAGIGTPAIQDNRPRGPVPDQVGSAIIADFVARHDRRTVAFDARGSFSPIGRPIVYYNWSFGDGTGAVGFEYVQISHTYAAPGRYTVWLAVADDLGNVDVTTRYVSPADTTVDVVVDQMFRVNCPYRDYWSLRWNTYGDVLLQDYVPCTNFRPWVLFSSSSDLQAANPSFVQTLYRINARVRNHLGYSLADPVFLPVFGSGVPPAGPGVTFDLGFKYIDQGVIDTYAGTDFAINPKFSDGFGYLFRGNLTMDLETSRWLFGVVGSTPEEAQAWWNANTAPGRSAGALESAVAAWLQQQGNGPYDIYNGFEWFYETDITDLRASVSPDGTTFVSLFWDGWGLDILLARWFYWGSASYVDAVNAPHGSIAPRGWMPMELLSIESATLRGTIGGHLDLDFQAVSAYHMRAWSNWGPDGFANTSDDRPTWVLEPWLADYVPRAGSGSPAASGYPNSELRWFEGTTVLHGSPGSYAHGLPYEFTYAPTRWRLDAGSSLTVVLPRNNVTWYDPVRSSWDPVAKIGQYTTFDAGMTLGEVRPGGDYFLWDADARVLSFAGPHDWANESVPLEGAPWIELVPGAAPPYPENSPPVAAFTVSPTSGTVNTPFTADASASWDTEDRPEDLAVRWDWEGDGSWDTDWSLGKVGAVRYAAAGTYNITLQVRDTGGLMDIATAPVTVTPSPPPGRLLERRGLVLGYGPPGSFDDGEVGDPTVLFDERVYHMWYQGASGGDNFRIGHATSLDGRSWARDGHVEFPISDGYFQAYPEVIDLGREYRMWYSAYDGVHYRIFAAASLNGVNWTRLGLALDVGPEGSPEARHVFAPTVVFADGVYRMWYSAQAADGVTRILYATSTDGLSWSRRGVALDRGPPESLEDVSVWAPTVRIVDGTYRMFYEGRGDTGRLFEATSANGVNWTRLGMVLDVLPPDEGVVSMPALLPDRSGMWFVYYTARPYLHETQPGLRIYLATRGILAPGLLRVTTSVDLHPELGVPGKILVDGVPRDEWSLDWLKLDPGRHMVSFSDVPDLGTPPAWGVEVVSNAVAEVVGVYQAYGWLRVTTDPAVPATISIDGVPRDDWGVWLALPPGTYEVAFGTVDGFRPPRPRTVEVVAEQLTEVVGTYRKSHNSRGPDPSTYGLLRVTTTLGTNASAGVLTQILIDGIARDEWGLDWLKLEPGYHLLEFTDVPGLGTPEPQWFAIYPAETTYVQGVFSVHGWLRVLTDPPVPGTIFVDGIPRNDWEMWQSMPAGTYTVSFGPVAGYETPARQSATVRPGTLTTITGTYRPPPPPPPPPGNLSFEFWDFFNVPYGEWWDYRIQVYGELPMNAECFNTTAISNGVCVPSLPDVRDASEYPYANWNPLPGAISPGSPRSNPMIYAPYRVRVSGVDVRGYNLSEPVFLPVLNYAAASGRRLDFDWRMQYVDTATAIELDAAGCGISPVVLDGYIVRSQVTLTLDLQESRRVFGVVAADAAAAQTWWNANTAASCSVHGLLETRVANWFKAMGGTPQVAGKYDLASGFEWFYTPFYVQIDATVASDGTTYVSLDTAAWGTEVLLARMFYWGNASYREHYLDSSRAAGWLGMEGAWFEDLVFIGSLGATGFNFGLSSVIQNHFRHLALPGPDAVYDQVGDAPYWTWGPILGDYTNDFSPMHTISELDRYPNPPCAYVHSTPGSPQYGLNRSYDYVPIAWTPRAGETWRFDFPTEDVVFYDPNLTPIGADPRAGEYAEIRGPLAYLNTYPPLLGAWDAVAKTWTVMGPTRREGPPGTPGPDGAPGAADDRYPLQSWGAIRLQPERPMGPTLKIGVVLPLTGALAVFGEDMVRAARLAADDVNAQGGIHGRFIELVVEDSQTNPSAAREAAWRLISEDNVSAIIGGAGSAESLAILEVTQAAFIPQISPSSTSSVLTTVDAAGVFVRTVPSDALEGRTAAWQEYVQRGYRRVAVFWANNAYGRGVSTAFRENFTRFGGTVVVSQAYPEAQLTYLPDLERLFTYDFDSVYFVGYPPDAERILSEWWINRDLWPVDWLLSGGLRSEPFFGDLAAMGVNVSVFQGVAPRWPVDPDREEYRLFHDRFLRTFGTEPGIFAPHAYDAVFAIALAALAGESGTPLGILGSLWEVDNGPGVLIRPTEWILAVEAVASALGIDYSGAAGAFTLDPTGDVGADYEVWAVDPGGRIVTAAWVPEAVIWP